VAFRFAPASEAVYLRAMPSPAIGRRSSAVRSLLVVDLAAAIPQSLLARADKVIE